MQRALFKVVLLCCITISSQAAWAAEPTPTPTPRPKITMDAQVMIHGADAESAPEIDATAGAGPLQVSTDVADSGSSRNGILHQVYDQSSSIAGVIFQTIVDSAYNGYLKISRHTGSAFTPSVLLGGLDHVLLDNIYTNGLHGYSDDLGIATDGGYHINMDSGYDVNVEFQENMWLRSTIIPDYDCCRL